MPKNSFLILLAFTLGLNLQAQKKVKKGLPNIVWITSEDNSKHYMRLFDEHGVSTPNIEKLAENGVTFTNAFSNAPVCSAARSTLISGCYGPRLASHYHRHIKQTTMPDGLEMYPAYLKKAGYYTANNAKEDYNIIKSDSVWDESSKKATWKKRAQGQPFYYVQNIYTTHESQMHFDKQQMDSIPNKNAYGFIQPNHPQTKIFEYTNARYRDNIQKMDVEVGQIIAELEADGQMDNTIIFYFSDHGGVLPGSKGYIYETGLDVPLVIYVPKKYQHLMAFKPGSVANGFVSFVDFGSTLLNIAGIPIPKGMDGQPFMGKNSTAKDIEARNETFGYADRFDEKLDMARSYRKGKYKYIRNFQPYNFDGLMNEYRYRMLAYQELSLLHTNQKLNTIQAQFYNEKPLEALFDVEKDPYETTNIAIQNPKILAEMREGLSQWMKNLPDLSLYPEHVLIDKALDNPVAFGLKNQANIKTYLNIANLALADYKTVASQITKGLTSTDPWIRYWTLNSCLSFKNKANELTPIIRTISKTDNERANRVLAAQFLAFTKQENPVEVMTNALYTTQNSTEALLILNAIVLMQDGYNYTFNIDPNKLQTAIKKEMLVTDRLTYLGFSK